MKCKHFLLASAVLLATGTMSFAAEPSAKTEGSQAAKQEKKICKSEKLTGSLTRVRRTCLTQAQWDDLAESTRRSVRGIVDDANRTHAASVSNSTSGIER
jgi:hypothetical protein